MPRGGRRQGAGRPNGSKDRVKDKVILHGLEVTLTPLAVMLEAMAHYHEAGERAKAVEVARHAAPYVHPRLSAIAIGGGEQPVKVALVEELAITHVERQQEAADGEMPAR